MYQGNLENNRSGPRAYHFHTNILGVNRAIHKEAEELLYKRNIFVVLSYEYPEIGSAAGGLFWLPIVSHKHAPRMKSHSVRIHVSPGTAGHRNPDPKGSVPMQSAIFLARDLDAFCLIMTTAGSSCKQTNLAIKLYANVAGSPKIADSEPLNTPKVTAPQFKCELRDTVYRQIDAATQRQILAPMAGILAPSQRVCFKGIVCDFQEVQQLKQTMSPTLNCLHAFKWACFEALSLAKDVADAAVAHDDIAFVMHLYHWVAIILGVSNFTSPEAQRERQIFLLGCPEAVEAYDILALEVWVNVACCAVKAGHKSLLYETGESIKASLARRTLENRSWEKIPAQLERLCYDVVLWRNLYCGADCKMPPIRVVAACLTAVGSQPHLRHDADILLRQPDQDAAVTCEHLPFDQCSALQLPLPRTAFHNHLLKQERFKGWLDMDLLRSLPEDLKKQINEQQKQHKIKVTAFEELDS